MTRRQSIRPTKKINPTKTKKINGRDKTAPERRPYDPGSTIVRGYHLPLAVGLSVTTAWRLRRAGKFPKHVQLGENAIGWRRSDLEAWIARRRGARS